MEEQYVKICPNCGGTEISTNADGFHIMMDSSRCRECNYQGTFPEVVESKVKDFKKNLNK